MNRLSWCCLLLLGRSLLLFRCRCCMVHNRIDRFVDSGHCSLMNWCSMVSRSSSVLDGLVVHWGIMMDGLYVVHRNGCSFDNW